MLSEFGAGDEAEDDIEACPLVKDHKHDRKRREDKDLYTIRCSLVVRCDLLLLIAFHFVAPPMWNIWAISFVYAIFD